MSTLSTVGVLLAACAVPDPATEDVLDACRFSIRSPVDKDLVWLVDGEVRSVGFDCGGFAHCAVFHPGLVLHRTASGDVAIHLDSYSVVRAPVVDEDVDGRSNLLGVVPSEATAARVDGDVVEIFAGVGVERWHVSLREDETITSVLAVGDDRALDVRRGRTFPTEESRTVWLQRGAIGVHEPEGWESLVRRNELVAHIDPTPGAARVILPDGKVLPLVLSDPWSRVRVAVYRVGNAFAELGLETLRVFDVNGRASVRGIETGEHFLTSKSHAVIVGHHGVDVVTPEGARALRVFDAAHDAAGTEVPRDARRTRVEAASSPEHDLIGIIERILLPGCHAEDRVHLLDLATNVMVTLATGDRVRNSPQFWGTRLTWVEGEADYTFVGD